MYIKIYFLLPIAYLALCNIVYYEDIGEDRLYDIVNDPLENTNIYNDIAYENEIQYMLARTNYWRSKVISSEIPSTDDLTAAWDECGCVGPIDQNKPDKIEIPVKYSYSSAPNIVYYLVDDWGWNDIGWHSTYLSWTTPSIDKLAAEGIILTNYFAQELCSPSRGSLLTGRYALRLGLWEGQNGAELPLNETTLAQELKSAGYQTWMAGKWHLGMSTFSHTPLYRGFDSYYGYYEGFIDYWNKTYYTYLDLHDGDNLVTDPAELSDKLHNAYLINKKAEDAIATHALNYSDKPMFLYVAQQLIHGAWAAPDIFLERCAYPNDTTDSDSVKLIKHKYCAMNLMLDESIANLTCTLKKYNMSENTILIIASDNGGEGHVQGNNYPYRGAKGSYWRGGVSVNAFVHSPLIPESARGTKYNGLMHATDWLPTLMGLATNNEWTGSLYGAEIDGVDMWDAMITSSPSPRKELVLLNDGMNGNLSVIIVNNLKLMLNIEEANQYSPSYIFKYDLHPENSHIACNVVSLLEDSMEESSSISIHKNDKIEIIHENNVKHSKPQNQPISTALKSRSQSDQFEETIDYSQSSAFLIMMSILSITTATLFIMTTFYYLHRWRENHSNNPSNNMISKEVRNPRSDNTIGIDERSWLLSHS